jgi:hypothetical protein
MNKISSSALTHTNDRSTVTGAFGLCSPALLQAHSASVTCTSHMVSHLPLTLVARAGHRAPCTGHSRARGSMVNAPKNLLRQ